MCTGFADRTMRVWPVTRSRQCKNYNDDGLRPVVLTRTRCKAKKEEHTSHRFPRQTTRTWPLPSHSGAHAKKQDITPMPAPTKQNIRPGALGRPPVIPVRAGGFLSRRRIRRVLLAMLRGRRRGRLVHGMRGRRILGGLGDGGECFLELLREPGMLQKLHALLLLPLQKLCGWGYGVCFGEHAGTNTNTTIMPFRPAHPRMCNRPQADNTRTPSH